MQKAQNSGHQSWRWSTGPAPTTASSASLWPSCSFLGQQNGTLDLSWWHSGIRICLPMQGTQIQCLAQEGSTCLRATKPVCCTYEARCLEPGPRNEE